MERTAGLIVDTNLLVLYVVGSVNPERIETFKRTRHARSDYDLLVRVLDKFDRLWAPKMRRGQGSPPRVRR